MVGYRYDAGRCELQTFELQETLLDTGSGCETHPPSRLVLITAALRIAKSNYLGCFGSHQPIEVCQQYLHIDHVQQP
jgi:hypothetical protein